MKKNTLEDIKAPVERKSIRNIPIPNRHRSNSQKEDVTSQPNHSSQTIDLKRNDNIQSNNIDLREKTYSPEPTNDHQFIKINKLEDDQEEEIDNDDSFQKPPLKIKRRNTNGGKRKRLFVWVFAFSLILIVLILNFSKSASMEIYPRVASADNINTSLLLAQDADQVESDSGLTYKTVMLENSAETIVSSEQEETVEESASGTIRVFNEFSTQSQRLITNTRFETSDGKIYRIRESLDVPGYTENNNQKTPGSIDVEVFADEAGESYNIGLTEFRIPGFRGQEQYDFFYAKSQTPMSGGFQGVRKIISEEQIEISTRELQARITQNILDMAEGQISKDYIYFNSPENYSFGRVEQVGNSNDEVTLRMNGVAEFMVIEKDVFAKYLANNLLSNFTYATDDVYVENINSLEITLGQDEDSQSELLNVLGNAKFIWKIDTDIFSERLVGQKLNNLNSILEETPSITKIDNVVIRPIWNRTFPKNSDKIDINLIID